MRVSEREGGRERDGVRERERWRGRGRGGWTVSAYVGISKNLQDLKEGGGVTSDVQSVHPSQGPPSVDVKPTSQ